MSPQPARSKPSLTDPDLSGLWSSARLGHEKKWYSKILGSTVHLTLVYSWIGGYALPIVILYLLAIQYTTTAILLLSMVLLPYLLPIAPQPKICRLYMEWGSQYFDGGTSMSFEGPSPEREPNQAICVAIHTHGIFCLGYLLCTGVRFRCMEDIHDKTILNRFLGKMHEIDHMRNRLPPPGFAANILVYAPVFYFFFTQITGCLMDASPAKVQKHMSLRKSFGILPGGFDEASAFEYDVELIYIKSRKGFIKYCLRYGYELWPVYIFGECRTYKNLFAHFNGPWINRIKKWLNKRKIPTVFPVGPLWWNPLLALLPFTTTGIHSIFSENTKCIKIENPTQKEIDEYHEWYMNEVVRLFETHKWRFGYAPNVKLKIL